MKKLNTKLASLLTIIGCAGALPGLLAAENPTSDCVCNPCVCDPCECGPKAIPQIAGAACSPATKSCCSFEVGIDTLYWKPCVDDLDFAAKVTGVVSDVDNPLHVQYKSVCPDWEPGFRITLKKPGAWKRFDLSFAYTWINAEDAERTTAGNGERIVPVGLHPNIIRLTTNQGAQDGIFHFARGKWELNYQTFDILLSTAIRCGSCHTITPFFGVEVVKLDQEFDVKYRSNSELVVEEEPIPFQGFAYIDWESDYRGAGLKLGTDYNYVLCDAISLFARASGTIAIGDASTHNRQRFVGIDEEGTIVFTERFHNFKDDDCCHVVPGYHLQLGLQYEGSTCGCEYKLRLGYETVQWCNLQNPRRWFESGQFGDTAEGNIAQSTQSNTTTFGFHGIMTGVEVKF